MVGATVFPAAVAVAIAVAAAAADADVVAIMVAVSLQGQTRCFKPCFFQFMYDNNSEQSNIII